VQKNMPPSRSAQRPAETTRSVASRLVRALLVGAIAASSGTAAQSAGDAPQPAPQSSPTSTDSAKPAAAPTAPLPNIVLVTIDTLRADHLGCYGYFRKTSPFLDQLASESLLFEHCYCTIPHTTPSHCSIMTGVTPLEHGVTGNSFQATDDVQKARALVTSPQLMTWAQILQKHGWKTGGFVTSQTTKKITGLGAGFDEFTEPLDDAPHRSNGKQGGREAIGDESLVRPGAAALADAKAWLPKVAGQPFFLWWHTFDVHGPHELDAPYGATFPDEPGLHDYMKSVGIPETYRNRNGNPTQPAPQIGLYDGAIKLCDGEVAELVDTLKQLKLWDRTVFVVVADHGEGLGQHEYLTHALTWDEQIRVPLIVHVPGVAPARIETVTSTIDLLPTLCGLVPALPREEILAQTSGHDVLAADATDCPVFAMAPSGAEFSLSTGRWKYIQRIKQRTKSADGLYDLSKDPHELADVSEKYPEIAKRMRDRLEQLKTTQKKRRPFLLKGGVDPKLSPEEEARWLKALEAMGYVHGEDDPPDEHGEKPKDGGAKKDGG
jgi:arylsulfatase